MKSHDFLKQILDKWPGKQWFGNYRFMPIFFCMGAALEYSMINWDFQGKVNFYRSYKNRQIKDKVEEFIHKKYASTSLLSMFAGAQVVHSIYRPLDDLEELLQIELEKERKIHHVPDKM